MENLYKYSNYIFDLDGTLLNSAPELLVCVEKAFKKANYKIDKTRLNSQIIGPPLREIIKIVSPELNDEKIISEIISNFRQLYDNEKNDISEIYEGVYELLEKLCQNQCKLFLATNKPKIPTMRILKSFNLNYFDDIYTIDKFETSYTKEEMINTILKEHELQKTQTIMIGDTLSDIVAAKKSGIDVIAIFNGYEKDKESLLKNANYIINSVKDLCQAEIMTTISENFKK